MEEKQKLLEVRDLQTHFFTEDGVIPSVDGVTFDVHKGETLAIVGESGCGKSVTSLSIMRLVSEPGKIMRGQILFEGKDLTKLSEREMRSIRGNEIAMIFQEPLTSLNPVFTVGDQVAEVLRLHQKLSRKQAKERTIQLLRKVGIPRSDKVYDAYPHELSGGMRQRVMIAMALSCNPKLLIADEPTTALDVTIQAQILRLMRELTEEFHTSIMLITHDLGVVAEMADRVIVMYAGQVVEKTDVFTLFKSPKHPYTQGLLNSTPKIHELKDELESIEGTVPPPSNMPKGCRFHPRCPHATAQCVKHEPALKEVDLGHEVRCWLYEDAEEAVIS
ncbi:oligopeptide/dipeptide ABC transporter, ATPase subunit [Caldalkalibacillus thermarum TA2.A1]|uniref:ABC transporter ATP-binding protein n=1 Tax=Caldalkalibacillus thermarum (strain TA2.A1) TaxID=986075 RepID=F5LA39_CALTT|nr:ABC transporter ATP-binding protein [Caldalkalibacillus thermarum]EGL81759.1 oligopeptide/dipeptide ABC transporter, ATPase subunit [Caldalkalibacillus thermarum TA2.A1]QZT34134.1 ABC transporter ATP-binding protein [Caldalkalibacillus thermarum TA2.A1]